MIRKIISGELTVADQAVLDLPSVSASLMMDIYFGDV